MPETTAPAEVTRSGPDRAVDAAVVTSPDGPYLDPDARRALLHRLARIEGHVRALGRMVERRECVDDILVQTMAVKGALSRFGAILVEEELASCVATCMDGKSPEGSRAGVQPRIDRLTGVLSAMLKQG